MKRSTLIALFLSIAIPGCSGLVDSDRPPDSSDLDNQKEDPRTITAREYLDAHGWRAGLTDSDGFEPKRIVSGPTADHVHFQRYYRGLPVLGGDIIVHGSPAHFDGFSVANIEPISVAVSPSIAQDHASEIARAAFVGSISAERAVRLAVDAFAEPVLVYEVVIEGRRPDGTPSVSHASIDAQTGEVLARWNDVMTADAIGESLYHGRVALDTTENDDGQFLLLRSDEGVYVGDIVIDGANLAGRDFLDADNEWGTGRHGLAGADRQTVAVDAFFALPQTRDYFSTRFGRDGFAGDGAPTVAFVHFPDEDLGPLNNAFYDPGCDCVAFGDGDGRVFSPLVSTDVVAHEWSHGLTQHTAGLIYIEEIAPDRFRYFDSGGLNEATSDIFAAAVEAAAANPNDPADWLIGEQFSLDRDFLRDMSLPSRDGQQRGDGIRSWDCYPEGGFFADDDFRFDPHFASGPANRFFYLLSEGSADAPASPSQECASAPAPEVTKLGIEIAAEIWYAALTTYMTPNTSYAGARISTLKATRDLIAEGSLDDRALHSVASAWRIVNVRSHFLRGDSNGDGEINLSDAVFTLNWLFQGTTTVTCEDAADFNRDGTVNISDAIATLEWLFNGGPGPESPDLCQVESVDGPGCELYPAEANVCAVSALGVIDDTPTPQEIQRVRDEAPELGPYVCPDDGTDRPVACD